MNAPTTHRSANTSKEAQFLAPETHPRADEGKDFVSILQEALTEPGIVNAAYRAFKNFSLGNQMLAAMQLRAKGLPLSPIASFNAWREKGRCVVKGQKAISLYMPVSVKRREKAGAAIEATPSTGDTSEEGGATFSMFMLRANWFSLDQTEGEDFAPELCTPSWDCATALAALDITEIPFALVSGNVLGYARGRTIAINPLNPLKHKTRFHEMAHVALGHTTEGDMSDTPETTRDTREVEAEGVAYLLCTLLDLPGLAESRSYLQGWLAGQVVSEKSARKIFGAADRIMKAGQPVQH